MPGLIEHAEIRFDPTGTVTRLGRHPRSRPGPRDDVPPDHLRQARHRARPHPLQLRRHRPDRDRHRHVRIALDGRGRHGDDHRRATRSSPRAAASPRMLMEAGEHDIVFEAGQVRRRRHRQGGRHRRPSRAPPSCRPSCRRTSRPACSRPAPSTAASAPIPTAVTSPRSRSTRRPAPSARALHRGRRRRAHDQSAAGGRPAPRRHRPGRRPGADGEHRL